MSYYKPSGKLKLLNLPLGLMVGTILSCILAFLYIWLGSMVSFIIVKMILLAAVMVIIFQITILSNRIAKNRNRTITLISILIFSTVLLLCSWIFFVVIVLERDYSDAIPNLWSYVRLLFILQEYSVSSPLSWFTGRSDQSISDWETYVILGGESIILLFGAFFIYFFKPIFFDKMVYCESCDQWTKNTATIKKEYFQVFTKDQLEEMIEKGDLSELLNLPVSSLKSKHYYEIKVYACEKCTDTNYIKIKIVNTTLKSKNKKNESQILVDYFLLKNKDLISMLQNFPQRIIKPS